MQKLQRADCKKCKDLSGMWSKEQEAIFSESLVYLACYRCCDRGNQFCQQKYKEKV